MTSSYPSLRESLLQLGALAGDLERHVPTRSLVREARDKIAERLSLPEAPTPEQQEALVREFQRWLQGEGPDPSAASWALAPFVYFRGAPPLATDIRFADRVASMIASEKSPQMLKRALYAYLRDYAAESQIVSRMGLLIDKQLERHRLGWAAEWRERAGEPIRLFDAPLLAERLAGAICARGIAPRAMLRELGLSAELTAYSGLHAPLAAALIGAMSQRLKGDGPGPQLLQQTLEFLREGAQLKFPDLRVAIADGFLSPFPAPRDPGERTRALLVEFFERLYVLPDQWQGVSKVARDAYRRWVVRRSLEAFFDVLSRTADPIWRYRRSFWLALYRHGLIEDAWPAFGLAARQLIRSESSVRSKIPNFGELKAGQFQQSVMVMKVRGFTIAEWSHAGACRIWPSDDAEAPQLGEDVYHATALRTPALFTLNHTSSMNGGWQLELAGWIARHTGVRVTLRELMADTHA